VSRIGLRRGSADADGGDPLDGLVNLFDLGLVLAVAFLVAGLGLGATSARREAAPSPERTLTTPQEGAGRARGTGTAVGTVYRLPDGRLVLQDPSTATTPAAPDAP
jgi:hypothetical protein